MFNNIHWVYLSIIRSVLVVILLILLKIDKSKGLLFPLISAILVGIYCLIYFLLFENHKVININFNNLLLHSIIGFSVLLISYIAIKSCPNPAYFRAFVGLEILLLTIYGIIFKIYDVTIINIIGCALVIIGLLLISYSKNNIK